MTVLVDIFGTLATIAVFALFLGPAPSVYAIHKTHSTGVTPILPLVSLFLNSWIWTIYGYLNDDIFPVMVSNAVGTLLAFIYTAIFYRWTDQRAYANRVVGGFLAVVVVFTVYAFVGGYGYTNQSRESVKNVFGYIGVITIFVFFSAPFENIGQVFRHRSGVFIPILLVTLGAVNSAMWVVYSLLTTDWFIFVPNTGAFVLASVQIALYFKFHPSSHPYEEHTADDVPKDLEASIVDKSAATSPLATVQSPCFVPLQSPLAPVQTRV